MRFHNRLDYILNFPNGTYFVPHRKFSYLNFGGKGDGIVGLEEVMD